jgi:hypothetical protein
MFQDATLKEHLETSSVIRNESLVIAEWNMNIANNIDKIGNYRYRPTSEIGSIYRNPSLSYDPLDQGNYYTDATFSDVTVDGGFDDSDIPITFVSERKKEELLYSLEDCLFRFRPRSGINKIRYFNNSYTHHSNQDMANRPRYYMAHKDDKFKYWTSYRKESGVERGIATNTVNGLNYIDDAAPFVIYKNSIPVNRIVVKMQTGVGTTDLGPFSNSYETFADPFFGEQNKKTPVRWRIQYLRNNAWQDAISFNENSLRSSGFPIIGEDGYVEVGYGLEIPEQYINSFVVADTLVSEELLPEVGIFGQAYLIKNSSSDLGIYYVWNGSSFESFEPTYNWKLVDGDINNATPYLAEFTNPPQYISGSSSEVQYREFAFVDGIRVVVETMNGLDNTFDLIEMSPRLAANISDKTVSYGISKTASDLGISGMPVGQLLASTGSIQIFDYDNSFSDVNTSSIISRYASQNIQMKFYEIIKNVESYDYYLPVKTMYIEGFPQISSADRMVTISLRDLYFYFESITAPQLLLTNVSLSYAVSTLLDHLGFSNYTFKRVAGESDPIIPYFFVEPQITVAQVLNDLAVSTQSTMFFDEYNNFVVMSKNYTLPSVQERDTDIVLYGSTDFEKNGAYSNKATSEALANIVEISSQDNKIFNDGQVTYTSRYIQKTFRGTQQAELLDRQRNWVYRPVIMWQGAPIETLRPRNGKYETSQDSLAAIPLNANLSSALPSVVNHQVIDNVIDLGEGVYYLSRYSGYFYANGEVIKYDAVQYSVPGLAQADDGPNVWVSSAQEYERYFSKIPFNGKIYPTGLIRIYSEPNYETIGESFRLQNGPVAKHGRGQFGTDVTTHFAGIDGYWRATENLYGCSMSSGYLFQSEPSYDNVVQSVGAAGQSTSIGGSSKLEAQKTLSTSIIKNFMVSSSLSESEEASLLATDSSTVQASALIMTGKSFVSSENPVDFISYIPKPLTDKYTHFGTRMRIVGKDLTNPNRTQSPAGSSTYYTVPGSSPDKSISIGASSGGIGVMLNPETNNGYFFEIAALTDPSSLVDNIFFYKTVRNTKADYTISSPISANLLSGVLTATAAGQLSIGGITPGVGERVLILESAGSQIAGYYVVTSPGSESFPWIMRKDENAIPVKLWGSFSSGIVTDTGTFVGMSRTIDTEITNVYDLAVEYENIGNTRRFYLYINNRIIATVDDPSPLPIYNNMALFVRGSARCMFENLYALGNNYAQNTTFALDTPAKSVYGNQEIKASDALKKYAMSGVVQSSYLSGISPSEPPKFKMYYEEFGAIMREVAYYNVQYDKAYPALYAKLQFRPVKTKSIVVSGFMAGAYGAEFLVFNATDSALILNENGADIAIQGITFTQESSSEFTVDEYFSRKSDFSNISFVEDPLVSSPQIARDLYQDIKVSRLTYGKSAFNLDAKYVQTADDAASLMAWMIQKVMKPRKAIGARIFSNPMIQLGDIVQISYNDNAGNPQVAAASSRFVVYNIEYSRSSDGPDMTLFLSEVG